MQLPITEISTLAQLWDQKYRNVNQTDTLVTFSENSEGLSYKKINAIAHCLAAYFTKDGIKKGDRIGMLCDNTPMYLAFDLAIHFIGAVNVSLSSNFSHKIIKQAINEFNIKILYVSSYDLYSKHKVWLDPLSKQLKVLCNVPPLLELSENDRLVALYCATDVGKIYWRENLSKMKQLKKEVEGSCKASIFINTTNEDSYKSIQFTHQELLNSLVKLSNDLKPITKASPKNNILCLESFHLYFGRMVGIYLTYFYGHKLILNRTNRTLIQDILRSKASIIIGVQDTLKKVYDAVRKQFIEEFSFRGKYFDVSFINARKVQELKEKNQKIPFGLSFKYGVAKKTTLVRARRKYFNSVQFIFTPNNNTVIDIQHTFLSLESKVFYSNEGSTFVDHNSLVMNKELNKIVEVVDYSNEI